MYTVVKKIIDGINIIGYVISDDDGIEKSLKDQDMIKLCKKRLLTNAYIIVEDGVEHLVIDKDLDKLGTVHKSNSKTQLKLICRIISKDEYNNSTCKGYIAKDDNGKNYRLDNAKAWKLARLGNIEGVEALLSGKKKILRSLEDSMLEDLPIMEA
jgi:hypothetical protein